MNVHPTDEQLSAFNDAQLDGAALRRIARHLDGCRLCQQSARALRDVREHLHSLPAPPSLPDAFWTDTLRRMRVDEHARTRTPHAVRGFDLRRRWATGIALATVLGAAVTGPLLQSNTLPIATDPAAVNADFVDVPSLVQSHTQSAGHQPLADPDRQILLSADGESLFAADTSDSDVAR